MKYRLFNMCLTFIGILGLTLFILITTPHGLPMAARIVSSVMPGELSVSGYSGRLMSHIHAEKITYQDEGLTVTLNDITLKWDPIRLLTQTLYIEHLEAKNILIERLVPSDDDTGFPLDLSRVTSKSLTVIVDHFKLHTNNTDISGTFALNEQGLRIRKAVIAHPKINIKLQANIGPNFNPPIKIISEESITLDGFEPMRAETRLAGNLENLEVNINGNVFHLTRFDSNQFKTNFTIPHQLIARYLTPRFIVTGDIDAQAILSLEKSRFMHLDLVAQISPMDVIRGKRKPRTIFQTGPGTIKLHINNQLLTSTGHLAIIDDDHLDWSVQINHWHDISKAKLAATMTGRITHWDPLRFLITDTNDFSGNVSFDIQANGPALDPIYTGSLLLHEARLAIPSHGLILEDGLLKITPSLTKHQLIVDGNVHSGKGTLKLTGDIFLKNRWPAFDLKIQGDQFMLSNTNAAVVYASPDIRLTTQAGQLDITGSVHIPEANLNIKGYRSYISPSPDIVLLEDIPPARSFIYDVNTHVSLSLGKNILLKASHLNTEVRGQLDIMKKHGAPARATGQLYAVNGKYAAYGKKLDLSKAVLSFNNSPIDNPALFIEASRKVQISQLNSSQYLFTDATPQSKNTLQDGTVGLRMTGTVQNPKYAFFSTPPMHEADQLSYLLTGAPSSQVGAAQAAFMFAALTETSGMLGVSDTDAARLQTIMRTIGIDFNIESGSHINADTGERVNDTNLVVGKAIRPRLYVSYTVGLLDPLNVFRVRYQLSRHWAAQSQANSQGDTGGDILYGIESDAFLGMD